MTGRHEAKPHCGRCGSEEVSPHCPNARCTWVKCRDCNQVSDTRKTPKRGSP